MMRATLPVLAILGTFLAGNCVFFGAAWALAAGGVPYGVPLLVYTACMIGWGGYALLKYRLGRQAELLQVLISAVELGMPLAPAIRAYSRDRPDRFGVQLVLAVLLTFVFPGFVIFWYLVWRKRYDRRVRQFLELLEDGFPLANALACVPAVASPETRLAVRVGEGTGKLGECLRGVERERPTAAWLELLPRLMYPLAILFIVLAKTSFVMIMIMPKYKRIFAEFDIQLPAITQALIYAWNIYVMFQPVIAMGMLGTIVLIAVVIAHPRVRWHLPVLGRLYQWDVQAQVLRLLGILLGAGRTAPAALHLLAEADEYPAVIRERLAYAADRVEAGQPLAFALREAGLLSSAMAPLLTSAEQSRSLPWALGELSAVQAGRAVQLVKRISLIVAPLMVLAVGGLVAFVGGGLFFPLIELISEIGE